MGSVGNPALAFVARKPPTFARGHSECIPRTDTGPSRERERPVKRSRTPRSRLGLGKLSHICAPSFSMHPKTYTDPSHGGLLVIAGSDSKAPNTKAFCKMTRACPASTPRRLCRRRWKVLRQVRSFKGPYRCSGRRRRYNPVLHRRGWRLESLFLRRLPVSA